MKAITPIDKFIEGAEIQGFYLCVEKHLRHTRSGDLYLDLVLRDRTGAVAAKVWDKVAELNDKFSAAQPVAVSGLVERFQDRIQLVVKKINHATIQHYARYGYDPALIVPAAARDPQEMWTDLVELIRGIGNQQLRKLVSKLYRENKERLLILPASMTIHHDYRSGYLEHVLSMARIGEYIACHYQADRDLLLTGVLLHDIGKLRELSGEFDNRYTDEGNFIGHIVIGCEIVREAMAAIGGFDDELSWKIQHLILAHQGAYEWGSPKKPAFKEALLLHLIDNLDAKTNLMDKLLADNQNDGNWTDLRNYFRTALYRGQDESDQTG
ncbi:MAG: HD domain-containing protein [Candidatus Neomarinimicrobiota bacterium]